MERLITFADLERAARIRDPELAELVISYASEPDPPPGQPEEPPASDDDRGPGAPETIAEPDEDAWSVDRLRASLNPWVMRRKNASERKAARREAWDALLASPNPPPRLQLGRLLLELYEAKDEPARSALLEILLGIRISYGPWQGIKRIYKLAEERHDAAFFAVLAYRFDAHAQGAEHASDVSPATFVYLRRRAWRYLRKLGAAVPEAYPQFAAQVLKYYPENYHFRAAWIPSQIWAHRKLIGHGRPGRISGPPADLNERAFPESWKISPEPLLRLLEDTPNDTVAGFAIGCLKKDHPDALRAADPRWLARIAERPLAAVHELLVEVLSDNPEYHASKLRSLGLHDTVLALLGSSSASARKFALEYARAHAADMPVTELVRWVTDGVNEVRVWAASKLAEKTPKELGLVALTALLDVRETSAMAAAKIEEAFAPRDVTEEIFLSLAFAGDAQRKVLAGIYRTAKEKVPAKYWQAVLADPRDDYRATRAAIAELGSYSGKELGRAWLEKTLFDPRHGDFAWRMLEGGALGKGELDVEWVKGLVARPRFRPLAIALLQNAALVEPASVGLPWLLQIARQADETLGAFARRYLLEHFAPADFAPGGDGVARLWELAAGAGEVEAVRGIAASYLELHHPDIHPTKPEARALGIKPRLDHQAYGLARVRPLFADERADVRRLAAAIGRVELVRWGDRRLMYELADSPHRETRGVAAELMLAIGEPDADAARIPPVEWLEAPAIFALAESSQKATRETALALIRRHYARLGGAARLAWLMESPDREVRLFAVRLLWEKHRPTDVPPAWREKTARAAKPGKKSARVEGAQQPFESSAELTQFLRRTMFGLPPGRMERREVRAEDLSDRPLAASIAKRRLIEVVRDLAKEDVEFARLAVPVIEELARSVAKGEWQACIAALAQIASTYPELGVDPAKARAR